MTDRFKLFFAQIIKNEEGYVNDPSDSGGETIYGITKRDHPQEFEQIKTEYFNNQKDIAVSLAGDLYEKLYYNPLYEQIVNVNVAFRLTDFGINAGVHTAVKHLQQTLKIVDDGIFGQDTLNATNEASDMLYQNYNENLKAYYQSLVDKNPKNQKFLQGWLNRLNVTV